MDYSTKYSSKYSAIGGEARWCVLNKPYDHHALGRIRIRTRDDLRGSLERTRQHSRKALRNLRCCAAQDLRKTWRPGAAPRLLGKARSRADPNRCQAAHQP